MTSSAVMARALVAVVALAAIPASADPTPAIGSTSTAHPSLAETLVLAGRVTDAANILPPRTAGQLDAMLAHFERRTKHQLVVVTVQSLRGEDIASLATRLGNRWGIGRANANDGILFLVAPSDHKVRIAVGFGLQSRLPDRRCAAILAKDVLPRFRAGDLTGGIRAGVRRIATALDPDERYDDLPPAIPRRAVSLALASPLP